LCFQVIHNRRDIRWWAAIAYDVHVAVDQKPAVFPGANRFEFNEPLKIIVPYAHGDKTGFAKHAH
jgi:hypothetical protein